MAAATYEITIDLQAKPILATEVLSSVIQNAVAFGLAITNPGIQYNNGQRRVRVTLSDPLPASEVESFGGTIVAV